MGWNFTSRPMPERLCPCGSLARSAESWKWPARRLQCMPTIRTARDSRAGGCLDGHRVLSGRHGVHGQELGGGLRGDDNVDEAIREHVGLAREQAPTHPALGVFHCTAGPRHTRSLDGPSMPSHSQATIECVPRTEHCHCAHDCMRCDLHCHLWPVFKVHRTGWPQTIVNLCRGLVC